MLAFTFIPVSVLASMSILLFLERFKHPTRVDRFLPKILRINKGLMGFLLLGLIVLAGISSTLLTINYWSSWSAESPNKISFDEISAMDYLRKNTDPAVPSEDNVPYDDHQLVTTLSDVSSQALEAFSGTGTYHPYAYKGFIAFNAVRPEESLYYFDMYGTDFLYLAQRDYSSLSQINNSFLGDNLQFFSQVYKNENAVIYEIPKMSPVLINSETALVLSANQEYSSPSDYALLMLSGASYQYTTILESDSGLADKRVLVLPSDPQPPTNIFEENTFVDGWNKSTEKLEIVNDGNNIELSYNNTSESAAFVSYEKELPSAIDGSVNRYLDWRVYIGDMFKDPKDQVDYAGIMLYDDTVGSWFWVGAISLVDSSFTKIKEDSWVDLTFDMQNNLWHNFESISKMRIVMRVSPNNIQTIKTDSVDIHKDPGTTYSPNFTKDLISWVNRGGVVVVLNSEGLGDFSKILKIQQSNTAFTASALESPEMNIPVTSIALYSISTNDPDVKVLANYVAEGKKSSPFALSKVIGNGSIIYMNVEPYFLTMENTGDDRQKTSLFSKMFSLVNLINLPMELNDDSNKTHFGNAFHNVDLLGNLTFCSDSIILPKSIEISELSTNNTHIGNIEKSSSISLVSIDTNGPVKWVLKAENASTASGFSLYSNIIINGEFEVSLITEPNSSAQIKVQNNDIQKEIFYTITNSESLSFKVQNSQSLHITLKTPSIHSIGSAKFRLLYIDGKLNGYGGTDTLINGELSFDVGYSDTFTLFSNLSFTGDMFSLTDEKIWNEWTDVPWINVLFAPDNLLLVAVVLLLMPHLNKIFKSK